MRIRLVVWSMSLLCGCLLLAGCSHDFGSFTLMSSKNVNLANFSNSEAEESGEQAEGVDCAHIICVFPTGVPNLKEATDRALESKNAYMLTNARVKSFFFYIPYIYGQEKITVTGTPVRRN